MPLTVVEVNRLRERGAEVVDARPVTAFAQGHVPGAVSIPLRPAFATWLGWLVADDRPLVIVRDADQDPAEIAWQARKVGYDGIAGELDGGHHAWVAAGEPTSSIRLVEARDLGEAQVLDIRQDSEFDAGHVPGAHHVELGGLAEQPETVPDRPTVVMCGHGERAMGAASLLARAGHRDLAVLAGGPQDWADATGRGLETSS